MIEICEIFSRYFQNYFLSLHSIILINYNSEFDLMHGQDKLYFKVFHFVFFLLLSKAN